MDQDYINEEHSKSIILNESDNIIIALDNMKAGQYLKNFDVTIDAPILSGQKIARVNICLLYTSPSPRDGLLSRMPSSA